jgi:hypothetical protein
MAEPVASSVGAGLGRDGPRQRDQASQWVTVYAVVAIVLANSQRIFVDG